MAKKGLKYEINIFDLEQIQGIEKKLSKLDEALQSEDFMVFLADKCMVELNKIIDKELRTEGYETEYRDNNNYETKQGQVRIYNDSMVDLSNLSPETLLRYPEGLSLAKIIEFGTGIPRRR